MGELSDNEIDIFIQHAIATLNCNGYDHVGKALFEATQELRARVEELTNKINHESIVSDKRAQERDAAESRATTAEESIRKLIEDIVMSEQEGAKLKTPDILNRLEDIIKIESGEGGVG